MPKQTYILTLSNGKQHNLKESGTLEDLQEKLIGEMILVNGDWSFIEQVEEGRKRGRPSHGLSVPKAFRISNEAHKKLQKHSSKTDKSQNQIINEYLMSL